MCGQRDVSFGHWLHVAGVIHRQEVRWFRQIGDIAGQIAGLATIVVSRDDQLLRGVEEMEGRECYRLTVTALERDADHFDGDVWIETGNFGLVRIVGEVADSPFPLVRITLDKVFEPGPGGFWLLRRRSGEAEAQIGFIKKSGRRHVFYYDYFVGTSGEEWCGE